MFSSSQPNQAEFDNVCMILSEPGPARPGMRTRIDDKNQRLPYNDILS